MEKRNVVEERRTPDHEFTRTDEDWDKTAAVAFDPLPKGAVKVDNAKDLTSLSIDHGGAGLKQP